MARAGDDPPALKRVGMGTDLSVGIDVPHIGTLPVCLQARGPLAGDERGSALRGRRQGEQARAHAPQALL